jgi:hypothetical protein
VGCGEKHLPAHTTAGEGISARLAWSEPEPNTKTKLHPHPKKKTFQERARKVPERETNGSRAFILVFLREGAAPSTTPLTKCPYAKNLRSRGLDVKEIRSWRGLAAVSQDEGDFTFPRARAAFFLFALGFPSEPSQAWGGRRSPRLGRQAVTQVVFSFNPRTQEQGKEL